MTSQVPPDKFSIEIVKKSKKEVRHEATDCKEKNRVRYGANPGSRWLLLLLPLLVQYRD